jgi:hypothetical protein
MVRLIGTLLFVSLTFTLNSNSRADDQAAAKEIIAKAIKAQGGEEKLAKIKAITFKDKGKYFGLGEEGIDYTSETSFSGPTKRKIAVEGEIEQEKFTMTILVNGDKGWNKTDDEVEEMEKEELDEHIEQMWADWNVFINPVALKSDAFKLSSLGEMKVEDKAVVGVKASCKGHRDLNLYFDKETGLLRKTEWQVKDIDGTAGGGEVQQEVFLSDYKDFNGVKVATKTVTKWAGKPYVESEISEFQVVEKLDDSVFAKPE